MKATLQCYFGIIAGLALCLIACLGGNSPMSLLDATRATAEVGGCKEGELQKKWDCKEHDASSCPWTSTKDESCSAAGNECAFDCKQKVLEPADTTTPSLVIPKRMDCPDVFERDCTADFLDLFCWCVGSHKVHCDHYDGGKLSKDCGE